MNLANLLFVPLYFATHFFLISTFCLSGEKPSNKKHCGVDKYNKNLLQQYPHLKLAEHSILQQKPHQQNYTKAQTTYTIPVVVHIVHYYGNENISNAAVIGGIADLNDAMRGSTQNNSFIHTNFKHLKTDTQIEFALAKLDPQGNTTTGIIRHVNQYYTENGDNEDMRFQYHWPRHKYLNLYIVKKPFNDNNLSGFATFPHLVNGASLAYLDGIVLAYWAFGRHNHLFNQWYYLIAHEVGHWLSLYHTWGPANQLCETDDGVDDTPNTMGNTYIERSECWNTSVQCNSLDNLTNLMDYASPCQAMFTPNQVEKMHTALNASTAERNNLHSPENLQQTLGTGNETGCQDNISMLNNNLIIENITANNTITTNGVVPASLSIMLHAENSIKLTNGFKVETGASFKAHIAPCTNGN